ncbi:MAG: hypothetical protein A3E29_00420 [Candidatus Doudnabacteria bacterium RIFCSPHIGHO2_12_FULL_48_16]|uniref:DUF5655 domain-containing protein n=1 Tax=Candidatus Doudnabacteria bacterium RIFCSPHIGHO2_12_FULL_48_16 TaxID=1817838 RepID=A0A1F5PIQ6_9BACT|nr:MAG: hypothetical protein A3E29_00420 [Candidatus Doudnabacteria bacterium RIFCSPHIGHO2_12_FULL_48_16]
MALFKINGTTVKKITAKDLDLERNLQVLFEANLDELLNISFLAHEYSTSSGGRIDTLGVDKDGAPCIIEYKKNQNDSVINQGLSYLYWLLDHKADFEKVCADKKLEVAIDWDSPRVICIAENYNKFDLDTVNILPINVELWRYRIYDENILFLEPENFQKVKVSTTGIVRRAKQDKERQPVLQKNYTLDHHTRKASDEIKTLFQKVREYILSIDEAIKEDPKKLYIAYKLATNFVDIEVRSKDLKIFLNVESGKLNDTSGIARDLTKPKTGHWGNGDYEVKLENESNLDAVFALIKQSYDLNK